MGKITQRQRRTLAVLYTCNICVLSSVALMPPFYPEPDRTKTLGPTKSGIIFGIFRLTMAIASPIYGKYMNKVGPKFLLSTGVYTAAGTSILMGVLESIPDHQHRYVIYIFIQILAALGTASVSNVIACLIIVEFPETSASVFASTEAALSLSMMVAPFITDIMEDVMGFEIPFVLSGCILLLLAFMINNLLPDKLEDLQIKYTTRKRKVLRRQSVILFQVCLIGTGISNGFFLGSLKYYLQPLHLSQFDITLLFILNSAVYSCSATCWGWLCDKKLSPLLVATIGAIFVSTSFLLSGLFRFFTINHTLSVSVISNIMFGIGNGAMVVSTFSGLIGEAFSCGLKQDIITGSFVGAIWNSCYCFGCFIGFTFGGILLDNMGYSFTALIITAIQIFISFSSGLYIIWMTCARIYKNNDKENIISYVGEDTSNDS